MTKIVKSKKNRKFTAIPNQVLQKETLSLAAKGLYCYILSLPDDWVIYKKEIGSHHANGRASLDTAWQELEDHGYLIGADQIREGGKFMGRDYIFYDLSEEDKKALTDVENQHRPMSKISIGDDIAKSPPKTQILEKNVENQEDLPMLKTCNGTDVGNQHLLNTNNTTKDLLLKDVPEHVAKKRKEFYESLTPYVKKYGKNMVRDFFDYWAELNKNKTKMRWEKEDFFEIARRLATWRTRDDTIGKTLLPPPSAKSPFNG